MSELELLIRSVILLFVMGVQVFLLLVQNRRNGMVSMHSAVMFTMLLYYGLVPLLIFFGPEAESRTMTKIQESSLSQFLLAECAVLFFTIAFHFIYRQYNNKKKIKVYVLNEAKLKRLLYVLAIVTLVVGGGALLGYIYAFGGIERLLYYADYIRAFNTSATSIISYQASLLVIPAKMITLAPIALITWLAFYHGRNRRVFYCLFLVSFVLSLIYNFANAGKTAFVVTILCYAVPLMQGYLKHPWRWAVFGGLLAIPFLGVLDSLFLYFQTGDWREVNLDYMSYLPSFSYPYANVLYMSDMVREFGLRWGSDFITAVIGLIPGLSFEPSYVINSTFFSGENWKNVGGTPNDIVTFAYFQMGMLGVVLIGAILGVVFGKIDRILRQVARVKGCAVLVTSMVVCTFSFLINADPSSVLRGQFQFYLIGAVIIYSFRIRKEGEMD